MKYVLMFIETEEFAKEFAALGPGEQEEAYRRVYQWFEDHKDKITDRGSKLQGPETATTVRSGENGSPVVVDGPYSEAKEAIGGFSVIDVESLDAALELARSWPSLGFPGIAVEVRPIVEHRMD